MNIFLNPSPKIKLIYVLIKIYKDTVSHKGKKKQKTITNVFDPKNGTLSCQHSPSCWSLRDDYYTQWWFHSKNSSALLS